MKKMILCLCLCLLCSGTAFADGLDTFLDNLNVQGTANRSGFVTSISSHFGVPYSDVEMIVGTTGSLADAFMIFQLGRMTGFSRDRIMGVYGSSKGRGWGVMAQELGIKPGSEQFHALKRGDFGFSMDRSGKGGDQGKGGNEHSGGTGKGPGGGKDGHPMPAGQADDHGGGKGKKK
jgi:hypothetical protein